MAEPQQETGWAPPVRARSQGAGGLTPRHWAILVHGLELGGLFLALPAIIGVVIAYFKRSDLAGTPYASHMRYAIRTFWIGMIASFIGVLLTSLLVGFLILGFVTLWWIYRTVRGLVLAIRAQPIGAPEQSM